MHEIINSTLLFIIFFYWFYRVVISRLEISIERTFWEKKPYGLSIMLWDYPRCHEWSNYGKSIFGFNWRNPEKIPDDIKKCK